MTRSERSAVHWCVPCHIVFAVAEALMVADESRIAHDAAQDGILWIRFPIQGAESKRRVYRHSQGTISGMCSSSRDSIAQACG